MEIISFESLLIVKKMISFDSLLIGKKNNIPYLSNNRYVSSGNGV